MLSFVFKAGKDTVKVEMDEVGTISVNPESFYDTVNLTFESLRVEGYDPRDEFDQMHDLSKALGGNYKKGEQVNNKEDLIY